jgi:hypothetical protein
VLRHLPQKQRYTLELLEPPAGGGGVGQRMDVRLVNFVLAHLPAGTWCARPGQEAPLAPTAAVRCSSRML